MTGDPNLQLPDFDNTEIAFHARSSTSLRKSWLLFKSFAYPSFVKSGPKLLNFALGLRLPVTPLVRWTVFEQFCGGVSIEDSAPRIAELARFGVGTILDYSVEAAQRDEEFERTTTEVLSVIQKAAGRRELPFAVFKVSGIARFALLEKLSLPDSSRPAWTDDERAALQKLEARFDKLCKSAHDHRVRILVDAEESWIQPAIDALALAAMRRFNRKEAIVYNTAQMYRVDRSAYLDALIDVAKREGFIAGIKLVRGAYMEKERARALSLGQESPIHADKDATDAAFNAATAKILDHLDQVWLVAGTHNEQSCLHLVRLMNQHGIKRDDRRIEFSQLLGMSDHLTYNLAHAHFNASKYVPYGPVRAVLPYLVRRAEENTSVGGQMGRELSLIERELRRRAEQEEKKSGK